MVSAKGKVMKIFVSFIKIFILKFWNGIILLDPIEMTALYLNLLLKTDQGFIAPLVSKSCPI